MMKWFIIFLAIGSPAFGQQFIEGKIVDADTGKPIAFASIVVTENSKGTSSNLEGQFSLSVSGPANLKITCVGYESLLISSTTDIQLIRLKPIATQLSEVIVFNKAVDPKKIVRKAFASIEQNYFVQPFMQKFFYRHYCKDDSVYGRLIEAFVDVSKAEGYRKLQKLAGEKEGIRVVQLRRSLDKTIAAQGHEPISIKNILQADIVGYQTRERSAHMSFYTDVSNLKTDLESYSFAFEGITTYDGQQVYEISYTYKEDSALTTSGKYLRLAQATGSLYIAMETYAFVKAEDVKQFEQNTLRTSIYYRKHNDKYYPYHFIRDGENYLSDNSVHAFHIELTSVEVQPGAAEKFDGHEPGREELLKLPYDSVFWNNNPVLKTTPLEDKIMHDVGEGLSLNKQFLLYRQYEMSTHDGGQNANEKFNWLKEYSKGKRILYLFFWSSDCRSYLADLEFAKRMQKKYRNKITFVLLSLNDDEAQWQQTVSKYTLFSDGIINYRLGRNSEVLKSFGVKETPAFVLISRSGEVNSNTRRPSDPQLESDLMLLLENRTK